MKKICALTMVRNDEFYLRKWVAYYGAELGMENLYVYLDGKDQEIPDWCPGVNVTAVDKIPGQVVEAEKGRLDFLSVKAAELLKTYDLVIGVDADEFLVVDPKLGLSLQEYLSKADINVSISGLGVDVGQHTGEEGDIRTDDTFLNQRHYARLSTRYTKPCVIAKPVRWGRGFHRIKGHNFHIGKDLFLFHFGYFDLGRIKARFEDPSRRAAGWTKHLERRSKTIRQVTEGKARDWDRWTRNARIIQTLCRPPYALNKPAMFELVIIVRIAERFRNIV
ncbi:MAG: glycosyltransferase family 2 protein [Bacteroidales bacterium]|nr:glycosyltransferase family 2 protein [Bacteroidales bacterium]